MPAGDPSFDALIREAPARLAEGHDDAAEGLRAVALGTRPDARAEVIAWGRVADRAPARAVRRRLWSGALVTAGAAAVIWFATNRGDQALEPSPVDVAVATTPAPAPAVASPQIAPPVPRAAARAAQEPLPKRVTLSHRPVALAPGRAALAAEATVDVAGGTSARATADEDWVRVTLDSGEVGLHVAKRVAGGPGFEVVAGAYHFRVLGTRFRVAREAARTTPVELWVDEGRVEVSRRGRVLSVVGAGGHWGATPAGDAPAPTAARSTFVPKPARRAKRLAARAAIGQVTDDATAAEPSTPMLTRARCAVLADEAATAREAIACYLDQARRDGVAGETALYEVARLRRDVLGDAEGALAALRDSRARFPRGMLRHEVDLSIVELLPKVNRHGEAIEEIGRLLTEGHGEDRGAELHMLRGNIYREVLEDFVRAERDYAEAEHERAPLVGDATFLRGVCLQALGRTALARAAFERYLDSGSRRYADEAKRRLDRLN
jgi:hypothetical protein